MSAAAYGNVRLQECKNTEFVWKLKRGVKQGGRKQSCPLTRVSVKRASTVVIVIVIKDFFHDIQLATF